jgi:D-serine deaminase-like pyridoxal phosphate-dependent protein
MIPPVDSRDDILTPALLVDLDAMEANIARMAAHLAGRGRGFRPHGKTHKCPAIAERLIAAGAVGICAAKLSEAEVFAAHGIPGLLVTTPVIGPPKIARAIHLAARAPDTIFSVDDPGNVRAFDEAAGAAGVAVNLAVDLFFGRTGIPPGQPALELARLIHGLAHARFAGLQAYDAAASHTTGYEARVARTRATMAQAVDTRRLIEQSGMPCPMVSSGSTGTYSIDAEIDGITELQPGSFLFMDVDYSRVGGPDEGPYRDFTRALTVITTVVSKLETAAIVDGGYKAFSTDRPLVPEAVDLPGARYAWAGDEHGRLDLSHVTRDVRVGDRIEFAVPHCDPTVNLYDRMYAVRGGRVEAVWPIAARGMSQ